MVVAGRNVWVEVEESASPADANPQTVLERYDGRTWTTESTAFKPSTTDWSAAEINAGQNYGAYLLCQFKLTATQRARFAGSPWTCPALAATSMTPIPGTSAMWAAGAHDPGDAMRPATALFGALPH